MPVFWTVASVISLGVNLFLFAIILLLGRELFTIKNVVSKQLIGGLYDNFVLMDQAHIRTEILVKDTIQVQDTITVNDTIPVVFNLPLQQDTEVRLTENTEVRNATIFLNGQAVPLDLVLKKGTRLNIKLDLTVPVSQTVPVVLNVPVNLSVPVALKVPVDIALSETDLHTPFTGLQNVIGPYKSLLDAPPNSWAETPVCGPLTGWLCAMFGLK